MTLQLRITKAPDGTSPPQTLHSIDGQGGTLGRGAGNTLVLPDPERILSSRHCEFVRSDNGYQIVDWSTNGTFLNNSAEPLGKGCSAPLKSGDVIEVGDYCFSVEVKDAGGGYAASPFGEDNPAGSDGFSGNDALPLASAPSDDPFQSDPFGSLPEQPTGAGHEALDPLQLLDSAQSPAAGSGVPASSWEAPFESGSGFEAGYTGPGPFEEPSASGAQMADPGAEALAWPDSRPENLIPDDWMEEPSGTAEQPSPIEREPFASREEASARKGHPLAGNGEPSAGNRGPSAGRGEPLAANREPLAQWESPSANAESSPADEWGTPFSNEGASEARGEQSLISNAFGTPDPATEFGSAVAMNPEQAAGPMAPRNTSPSDADPQSVVPPRVPRPGAKSDRKDQGDPVVDSDALFTAMGFDASRFSAEERAELLPLVGKMIREVVEGMMQVLRSRASIKNEFRMNVTTIQPVENNPLKFSADVDEALDNIFVRRSQAYKEPLAAVREGFQEIAEHQLAMIAGMRSAFEHMLRDFDSDRLEARFDQQRKRGVIPLARHARYWRQYQNYYRGLSDNIERSFQQIFGDEFVQAYQDQLRRLSSLRPS